MKDCAKQKVRYGEIENVVETDIQSRFLSPVGSRVIPQASHPHSFPDKVSNRVSQSSPFIFAHFNKNYRFSDSSLNA